ncbi:hypothetical protein RGQ21_66390 [Kitasatospora aureofaciens]|nr:hypothetical protein RGQ21_66390 [Kitasatospora aureofaciens]
MPYDLVTDCTDSWATAVGAWAGTVVRARSRIGLSLAYEGSTGGRNGGRGRARTQTKKRKAMPAP